MDDDSVFLLLGFVAVFGQVLQRAYLVRFDADPEILHFEFLLGTLEVCLARLDLVQCVTEFICSQGSDELNW
jgi:hypothetical protein